MLLAEKISGSMEGVEIILAGRKWLFPGAAAYADRLTGCVTRYVLSEDVQQACCQLAEGAGDLLLPENPRLRAAMPDMWIEWAEPAADDGTAAARVPARVPARAGVLVDASPDGRKGELRLFWAGSGTGVDVGVDVAQVAIRFDFDQPVELFGKPGQSSAGASAAAGFPFHSLPAQFAALRRHLAIVIDDRWADYFRASALGRAGLPDAARQCGDGLWRDVIRVLAFFVLMSSRVPLAQYPVQRGRLNLRRAKAGKPALLDHVELRFGDMLPFAVAGGAAAIRRHPRMHVVRGHLVRRRGGIFWRTAHIRGGAPTDPLIGPTRHVRMGGGQ